MKKFSHNSLKLKTPVKLVGLVCACAFLLALGAAAVRAPRTIPLEGTLGTTFKLIPTATPGVFDNPVEGIGNLRDLGPCTILIHQVADFRSAPPSLEPSEWVLTFVGGDQIRVSFHGTGTPYERDPSFFRLSGTGLITGGTGRFANVTGELRAPGLAHVDTAPGGLPAEGHGTVELGGFVRLSHN